MEIKNILQSLHDEIIGGKITYRDAAKSLYLAGWFNFVPNEDMVRALLKL